MSRMLCIVLLVVLAVSANAETFVAILDTYSKVVKTNEKIYVADKIRSEARKVLPKDFVIMTRENIFQMLPPGKSIEECEGSCLVETGKNISADYICQGRIDEMGTSLYITIELYSTADNNLVSSISERAASVDELANLLEQKVGSLFSPLIKKHETPVFYNVKEDYVVGGDKLRLVKIASNPAGALVAVDGRPVASCKRTPCSVELPEGNHRLVLGKEYYFDKDTVVNVTENSKNVTLSLAPKFGVLDLQTAYSHDIPPRVTIDGKGAKMGVNWLSKGKHHVNISHKCYEPLEFDIRISLGETQIVDQALKSAEAGLELSAEENGVPKEEVVFVDGKKVGVTPYKGAVPLCSKIELGNEVLDSLNLEYRKTVKYRHKVGSSIPSVKIGNQIWMSRNSSIETPRGSWCLNNKEENCKKYGRFYDKEASRMSCPTGWHLPSDDEFAALAEYLGKEAGKRLKSKTGWNENKNGTDEFGFNALPTGQYYDGKFDYQGNFTTFWTSTDSGSYTYFRVLSGDDRFFSNSTNMVEVASVVRCIKNSSENQLKSVKIGDQVWMAENLNIKTPEGSWCYNDDESMCKKYGRLYDWKTAKKVCPAGWHLPTSDEYAALESCIGKNAGKKLKSNKGWTNSGNGTDEFGFAGLPGGKRQGDGSSFGIDYSGSFWTASETNAELAEGRSLNTSSDNFNWDTWTSKKQGNSVRCVKNKSNVAENKKSENYKSVKIGDQVWMAENLNIKTPEGSWCFENKEENCKKYGRLYNWMTAHKICPAGWRLPENADFDRLLDFLGGSAGARLKSKKGWDENANGTDDYGFAAMPAAYRYDNGGFSAVGGNASFWSDTKKSNIQAYFWYLDSNNESLTREHNLMNYGLSVRCIK